MAKQLGKVIIIEVQGGCVINVSGMPVGYQYEIKDHDVNEEGVLYAVAKGGSNG